MKVLFLANWYPHRYDAMEGLFIQKHAFAVASFADICVLHMRPDANVSSTETTIQDVQGVKEIIIYHSPSINLLTLLKLGMSNVQTHWGMPDIVHAHVFSKCTLLALLIKLRYGIPYVITEHWSGFLPQNNEYEEKVPLLKRPLFILEARLANALLPVSNMLAANMAKHHLRNSNTSILHNVVDDFFFSTPLHDNTAPVKTILHVSCFDERAKNVRGLLRAVKTASRSRSDFRLVLVGTGRDHQQCVDYAQQLEFPDGMISFTGELPPTEVAQWMQKSDFFLFFSNYENAPVVLSECMASGLPVLTSNAGGIPEMMNDAIGRMVPVGDEDALASQISWMLDHSTSFDKEKIRQAGQSYSMSSVARQLKEVYTSVTRTSKTQSHPTTTA